MNVFVCSFSLNVFLPVFGFIYCWSEAQFQRNNTNVFLKYFQRTWFLCLFLLPILIWNTDFHRYRSATFVCSIKFGCTLMLLMPGVRSSVQSIAFGWKVSKKLIQLHSIHPNGWWYISIAQQCGKPLWIYGLRTFYLYMSPFFL